MFTPRNLRAPSLLRLPAVMKGPWIEQGANYSFMKPTLALVLSLGCLLFVGCGKKNYISPEDYFQQVFIGESNLAYRDFHGEFVHNNYSGTAATMFFRMSEIEFRKLVNSMGVAEYIPYEEYANDEMRATMKSVVPSAHIDFSAGMVFKGTNSGYAIVGGYVELVRVPPDVVILRSTAVF